MKCPVCDSEFERESSTHRYCSLKCKETQRNPDKEANRYRFRAERREYMDKRKLETGCQVCGYNSHPAALTFDHLDPSTKRFTPAHGITRSWETLLRELDKCRILCANCHNIHSHNQRRENGQG